MRKLFPLLAIPLLTTAFSFAKPQEANAWLKVCNKSGGDRHVAIAMHKVNGSWVTKGWFVVGARSCQEVYSPALVSGKAYYIHTQNYNNETNVADARFCNPWVQNQAQFEMIQSRSRLSNCNSSGKSLMPFQKLVADGSNITFNIYD